ncbi:SCO family protein [Kiloniella sp. b19]|uniref:SCO family protein n=1 Tax=Kiloniella sp. GXU_MW_B19 TaxID=3141326 RepID=UPI0031D4C6C6
MDKTFNRLLLVLGFGLMVAIGGAAGLYLFKNDSQGTSGSGTALIGGPFELTSHEGQRMTQEDFKGKYMLIYFGYTYCPDVCPTSLALMSQALDNLEKTDPAIAEQITPVFITVDPERDQVEEVAAYVSHFYPGMVGLTGSPEDVRAAAKSYRVFYQKAESSEASDYLVDHSSITYLMGPDGTYVQHFAHGTQADAIASKIRELLG